MVNPWQPLKGHAEYFWAGWYPWGRMWPIVSSRRNCWLSTRLQAETMVTQYLKRSSPQVFPLILWTWDNLVWECAHHCNNTLQFLFLNQTRSLHSLIIPHQKLLPFFSTHVVRVITFNRRKRDNIGLIFFVVEEIRVVPFLKFSKTKGFWPGF